jgi:hypothetical protein
MTHLRLHETPNPVSIKPAAAHTKETGDGLNNMEPDLAAPSSRDSLIFNRDAAAGAIAIALGERHQS